MNETISQHTGDKGYLYFLNVCSPAFRWFKCWCVRPHKNINYSLV